MFRLFYTTLFILMGLSLAGCSDSENKAPVTMSDDNVFKGQVDSLQKAENVEGVMHDSFNKTRQQIDSQ